jgi:hypothetical protein
MDWHSARWDNAIMSDTPDSRTPFPTDGEGMPRQDEEASLAEELGLHDELAPDAASPPVDDEYLRRYVRKQLTPEGVVLVADMVALFGPWRRRLAEIQDEEASPPEQRTG